MSHMKNHCGVTYPHPKHGSCDGAAGRPWPFPLPCEMCNDTGWCHGAQEWTPERMSKGTPYKSVRCDCGAVDVRATNV